MKNSDFVHLHVHSEYSLLDGACRIDRLIDRALELGQKAIAITDHGVMYGVVDFYKEAKKKGIKPIIGCEVYVARRSRHDKEHRVDNSPYHLVLLCKNEVGYQILIKLVSLGYIEGFYSKPRIDRELLEKYHEGLVCLSACLAGELPRLLLTGDYEGAKEAALFYKGLFGEDYYIELQDHGIDKQQKILPDLMRLAEELDIKLVATNDSHYLRKEDARMQQVLVCISTNTTIFDDNKLEFETDEFYLKSTEEMAALFSICPDAVTNTAEVADKCNFDFEFGVTKLPAFLIPGVDDNNSYFEKACWDGLNKNYDEITDELKERLQYEIDVIEQMGYVDYFLIVADFINFAKSKNIPVGPGRGSGAGSLAAYALGITGIDPIKYNLLFERFLNPERVSMPDFDIDFCYERRQEVIDYVIEKYGADHVAQIITFGTLAARAALRSVGKALGVPYGTVDTVAKSVPFEIGMTLDRALSVSEQFKKHYDSDPQIKEMIEMSQSLEGMPRHSSTHAAGVVITREPASHYVPLQQNDDLIVTQYTMGILEELGLLKMDFLGLRTLTAIRYSVDSIHKSYPEFDLEKIDLVDKNVFEMMSDGYLEGVFQFESTGMKQTIMNLRPERFEDLIAVISLYRPGPMQSIPRYIRNRHDPSQITYKHERLRPILDVTYGCIVYQEQVMEICRELAGFSYGQADLVRRAMSKKKADIMAKERQRFIYGDKDGENSSCVGCIANGIDEATANSIFDEMDSFAEYAFNKSHAAAYALISYQTAYLKCHYPKEFMAGLLTTVLESATKVSEYITECKRLGIKILPLNVNSGTDKFLPEKDGISFSLLAIKNIGRNVIDMIVRERERNGLYESFYDFCRRVNSRELTRRVLENLIKSGACDCFGHGRKQMVDAIDPILADLEQGQKRNIEGQFSLFGGGMQSDSQTDEDEDALYVKPGEEYTQSELLSMEKETLGLYMSGHPLDSYGTLIKRKSTAMIGEILKAPEEYDDKRVTLIGVIIKSRIKTVRNSQKSMAFLDFEDLSGLIEAMVLPAALPSFVSYLEEGQIVEIRGKISAKEEEAPKLMVNDVLPVGMLTIPEEDGRKLYLKMSDDQKLPQIKEILQVYSGGVPVFIFDDITKKLLKASDDLWIRPCDGLISSLADLLGESNVVMK